MAEVKFPMIHVDHPEDERFDEIHIKCVERWKESELSGDEWRFSYVATIKRKGEEIGHIGASTLDWLLKGLQWRMMTAGEDGKFDQEAWQRTKSKCDQPGCSNLAIIFYKRLKRFTKQGEALAPSTYCDGNEYRQFCDRHKHRGDCGLDDADYNYALIVNPNEKKED